MVRLQREAIFPGQIPTRDTDQLTNGLRMWLWIHMNAAVFCGQTQPSQYMVTARGVHLTATSGRNTQTLRS